MTASAPIPIVHVSAPVQQVTTLISAETSEALPVPSKGRVEMPSGTSAPLPQPRILQTSPAKTSGAGGTLAKAPPSLESTAGVYVAAAGLGHREDVVSEVGSRVGAKVPAPLALSAEKFAWLLGLHIASLDEAERGGSTG